ncbi:MAG: anti-phage dCTP deaminase, partial [Rhabdochlamydiaceae bacterium]
MNAVQGTLRDHLGLYGYHLEHYKLSTFLQRFKGVGSIVDVPHDERTRSLMDAGNRLRELTGRNDILAMVAINEIHLKRAEFGQGVIFDTFHVLESLKRPEEVDALRRVYGDGFFLLGLYSSETHRLAYLMEDKGLSEEKSMDLIRRDQNEDGQFGQRTRATFQLADAFINLDAADFKQQTNRIIDLLLGEPFTTPTRDEHAMFLAYASSLRSADLSRQVGAVILSASGEIIATGANDVPKFGGGLYWPGIEDARDYVFGEDSNAVRREEMIQTIIELLKKSGSMIEDSKLRAAVDAGLSKSLLLDITEFGRPVHAEMEALLACARI